MQEAGQTAPPRERVADGFGKRATARYKGKLSFEPDPQGIDNRLGAIAARCEPVRRRVTADIRLYAIELCNPPQCLGRDRSTCASS
jgi:hypothetical protein